MTTITQAPFDGDATLYTLHNRQGMSVSVLDHGAAMVSWQAPDREGRFADVVLGYDGLAGYRSKKYYLGATIGRFCGRIARGRFTLGGRQYQLACNDNGRNHLHGGLGGFDQRQWQGEVAWDEDTGQALVLRLHSPDGEDGYPGDLEVSLHITLDEDGALTLRYRAQSSADTLCSLTNHSYFNLRGHDAGDVLDHRLRLWASHFLENNQESIPTGRVLPVEGSTMDFRAFHTIGSRMGEDCPQLQWGRGYDHSWVLDKAPGELALCAQVYEPQSGRLLSCYTDLPCVQLYTGNYLDGTQDGKGGVLYSCRAGLCLETQFAPDSPNRPQWPSPVLKAGEVFRSTTVYKLEAEGTLTP